MFRHFFYIPDNPFIKLKRTHAEIKSWSAQCHFQFLVFGGLFKHTFIQAGVYIESRGHFTCANSPPPVNGAAWCGMKGQVYLRMLLWSWWLCCCSSWACSLMASCSSSDCWLRPSISHCSRSAFFCQSNTPTSGCQQRLHLHYLFYRLCFVFFFLSAKTWFMTI